MTLKTYSLHYILFENWLILIQLLIGGAIIYQFNTIVTTVGAGAFIIYEAVMLLIVLRRELCTNCIYYGKSCHCGWGKLAALLFSQHSGNYQRGAVLAGISWLMMMVLPLIAGIAGMILSFSLTKGILFGLFIAAGAVNLGLHKKDCSECSMREKCPAAA